LPLHPQDHLPQHPLPIRRALLSVSDKTGIVELGKALHRHQIELISTDGTATILRENGLPVTNVSKLTGYRECLDGRVKTLHPSIYAALLARTSYNPDRDELQRLGIKPIELVVVNLYPFQQTVTVDADPAFAVEYIDIGGPTMIRAAAKNFGHVCVLTNPDQYEVLIRYLDTGHSIPFTFRKDMARRAFAYTADYDVHIAAYFQSLVETPPPDFFQVSLPRAHPLRYGENPHQKAAVYGRPNQLIETFHGKQLSYNNYLDIHSALRLMKDLGRKQPACAIIKHTIPSGAARGTNLHEAYESAFLTDTAPPFGGIVIVNRSLDRETAETIDRIFTEIIIAPDFEEEARELLTKKRNRRLVRWLRDHEPYIAFRSIVGGTLVQDSDDLSTSRKDMRTVTRRKPTDREWSDLLFAWTVVKHVTSNAIVFARGQATLGIGPGQTSRIDSSEIAVQRAAKYGLTLSESVVASDAFYPFADGLIAAQKAGATAVIQPGGSIRDAEVIETANRLDMAMVFTGVRHFRHG